MFEQERETQVLKHFWARLWGAVVVSGLISVVLGIYSLVNPQATAALPVQLLGGALVLHGLYRAVTAVLKRDLYGHGRVTSGLFEALMGAFMFVLAAEIVNVAFTLIFYLAGFGFVIAGSIAILLTVQGQHKWTTFFSGALILGLGILLFALTGPLAVSLVWVTGSLMLGVGALLLYVGWRMWRMQRRLGPTMRGRMSGNIVEGEVIDGEIITESGAENGGTVIDGDAYLLPDKTDE
jgi:uncharacterized membrane protein HdeD (DUF308 family)